MGGVYRTRLVTRSGQDYEGTGYCTKQHLCLRHERQHRSCLTELSKIKTDFKQVVSEMAQGSRRWLKTQIEKRGERLAWGWKEDRRRGDRKGSMCVCSLCASVFVLSLVWPNRTGQKWAWAQF